MDEMQAASSNDLLHRLAKDRHKRMQKRQEVQLLCSDPCTDGDSLLTAPPECGGYIQKIIIKEKNLSIVKPTRKMSRLKGHSLQEQGPGDATNDVDASQSKGHPLYHRIDIKDDDGQNITWMPQDDLNNAVDMLLKALRLRLKHMRASQQRFPQTTSRCLRKVMHFEEMKAEQQPVFSEYPADLKTAFDQDVTNVPSLNYSVAMLNGVLQMFKAGMEKLPEVPELKPTLLNAYLKDMDFLLKIIQNGPVKTYCSRRLKILSAKFELHQLTNHLAEMVELKVDGKQDFQSVCKVDTHVHAAAAMTQNELLNIMCKTYEQDGDVKVYKDDSGHEFSLCELYQKLHLNPKNIRLDTLDVHVDRDTFDRFDKFDKKYNPLGRSELKKVYLNTDNLIQGRYFADLVKGVAADYKQMAGNCFTELRISVRGTSPDEWSRLADWFVEQEVYSPHIRWVVQLPRHFQDRNLHSFGSLLENFFRPILEATVNPADCTHRNLHLLLKYVTGFDSVADESPEEKVFLAEAPPPEEWLNKEDPPYSYYIYYMYANMAVINYWRRKRDMNTFVLRPHSGEAGHFTHLLDAFLTSDNISHGINLTKNPVVQYLYYLAQIPIAMSPISNNSLFVEYEHNPFYEFFQKGLVVSLSTDDPLIFHTTNDPLLEEYAMASHFWKLTPCDLCEIASNSVRQSGLSHKEKQLYLGLMYQKEGIIGNELNLSNVAPIRVAYRYETLSHELRVLETAN